MNYPVAFIDVTPSENLIFVSCSGSRGTFVGDSTGFSAEDVPLVTYVYTVADTAAEGETFNLSIAGEAYELIYENEVAKQVSAYVAGTVTESCEISGKATSGSGQAISSVTVTAYNADANDFAPVATTTTNLNGNYSIDLPNGTYELYFSTYNYADTILNVVVAGKRMSGQNVQMDDAYQVFGSIFEADRIEEIPGVRVEVYLANSTTRVAYMLTGEYGNYRFYLPNGLYEIRLSKDGYTSDIIEGVEVNGDILMVETYRMARSAGGDPGDPGDSGDPGNPGDFYAVSGVATDEYTGLTLSSVTVTAYNANTDDLVPVATATTSYSDGSYSIGLPNGTYELYFSCINYADKIVELTVSGGPVPGFDVALSTGYSVSGSARDAETFTGLPSSRVEIFLADSSTRVAYELTNQYGMYTCYLPNGLYDIRFNSGGYAEGVLEDVVVAGEGQSRDIELTRSAGGAYAVSGKVTASGGGQALSLVDVTAYNANADDFVPVATADTDSNGNYSIALPDGTYELYFSRINYADKILGVTVSGGRVSDQHALMASGYHVFGYIYEADRIERISGVRVEVYPANSTTRVAYMLAGEHGDYRFYLPNGLYDVRFSKDGYVSGAIEDVAVNGENILMIEDFKMARSGETPTLEGIKNPGSPVTIDDTTGLLSGLEAGTPATPTSAPTATTVADLAQQFNLSGGYRLVVTTPDGTEVTDDGAIGTGMTATLYAPDGTTIVDTKTVVIKGDLVAGTSQIGDGIVRTDDVQKLFRSALANPSETLNDAQKVAGDVFAGASAGINMGDAQKLFRVARARETL